MGNTYISKILEEFGLLLRGIKIVIKIDSVYLVQQIFRAILSAITPFVGVYFTAQILNEISGNRDANKLIIYAVLVLVISLIFSWIRETLNALIMVHQNQWDSKVELYFNKINYDMEFIYLENPDVKLLKNKINTNNNATYAGLSMIVNLSFSIVTNLSSLIVSLFLMKGLFSSTTVINSDSVYLKILNSKWVMVAFIVTIMLLQVITIINNNKEIKEEYGEWSKLPESNKLIGYYSEMLKDNIGAMDIRLYNQKDLIMREVGKWTDNPTYINKISKIKERYGRINIIITAIVEIFINLYIALKIFFGIYMIGYFIQYTAAIHSFTSSLSSFIDAVSRLFVNNKFLVDTFTYFDYPKENVDNKNKQSIPQKSVHTIEFKNVSFQYPSSDKLAINGLNLTIHTGYKYAIVGMNGSGKSTFIKILCGLYKVKSGTVLLDGQDITTYKQDEYRDLFSAVFQDFNLFSFPLGQNISGSMEYDKEKAELCLDKVGFTERYSTMDKKLDTILYKVFSEDGVEISGGESQKIAIARALYKDAPILIMDEPTSALDPKAELEIYTRLNEIVNQNTVIFVSHRLSSCKFCDKILVFDEGKLIQQGSHDELLQDELGKYYEMWTAQAQYYAE